MALSGSARRSCISMPRRGPSESPFRETAPFPRAGSPLASGDRVATALPGRRPRATGRGRWRGFLRRRLPSRYRDGLGFRGRLLLEPGIALLFQLECELLASLESDPAVDENVQEIRHDVVQQPLVVRHDDHGALRRA